MVLAVAEYCLSNANTNTGGSVNLAMFLLCLNLDL